VGLERGSLSLVRINEELLEWKSSGSGSRKSRLTDVGIRCADQCGTLYPQKLALNSPTISGYSVGIVRLQTKATKFSFVLVFTDPLPINILPIVARVGSRGIVCTESLPSNGSIRHISHHLQNQSCQIRCKACVTLGDK
jgi:hypothetical protein